MKKKIILFLFVLGILNIYFAEAKCFGLNAEPFPEGTRIVDMCKIKPPTFNYFWWGDCKYICGSDQSDPILIDYPHGYNYNVGDGMRTECWKVNTANINSYCHSNTHVCNADGLCVPKQPATCSDPDGLGYYNKNTVEIIEHHAVTEAKTDLCSGDILTEYTCDGVNIKSNTYNCLDEGKKCVNGACREPDLSQNYCTDANWGWLNCDPATKCEEVNAHGSICCGDDANEYYITSAWSNSETTDPVCCSSPNDKIHNNKCASKEPSLKVYSNSFSNPTITLSGETHYLQAYTLNYGHVGKWCASQPHTPPYTTGTKGNGKYADGVRIASYKAGAWRCYMGDGFPPCPVMSDYFISSLTCIAEEWLYDDVCSSTNCGFCSQGECSSSISCKWTGSECESCKKSGSCSSSTVICDGYYCSDRNVCADGNKWNSEVEFCIPGTICSPTCNPYTQSCAYPNSNYCKLLGTACCPVDYGDETSDCLPVEIIPPS